eukprot:324964-Hanusia_phi.AAC.2
MALARSFERSPRRRPRPLSCTAAPCCKAAAESEMGMSPWVRGGEEETAGDERTVREEGGRKRDREGG